MSKAGHHMTGKILVAVLLVALIAMSSSQLGWSPSSSTQHQDDAKKLGDVGSSSNLAPDAQASPRPMNESAVGLNSGVGPGLTINLPSASQNDLPVTLDYAWKGSKLYTTVLGLSDQRNWANNGNFTSNSNGWSFWPHNVGTYNNPITNGWASSGAGGNPGYVWGEIDGVLSGGFYRYDAGDTFAWNQTVNIPRGTLISATLEFKYYVVGTSMLNTLGANIYGWVGSGFAFQISYPAISLPYASWHSVSVSVPLSNIALPNVLISLGHYQIGSYGYSSLPSVRVYFDEVRLTVRALVQPEQIKLRLAAPGSPNTNVSIVSPSPSTYGAGSGTLTGFTIGPPVTPTSYYFDFTSNVSYPATGSFAANATIYATRQNPPSAKTIFVNQGANVEWSVSLQTAFQSSGQSIGTTPGTSTSYTMYYFNVSVPSDWSLTTCLDPSGRSHSIGSEANNFSVFTVGSKLILRVNVTRIGSYSVSPSLSPYVIHALSANYVKNVFTQIKSGSLYANSTTFYPQNTTRISAYIAGPGGPVSSGIANLTILGPTTYNGPKTQLNYITGVQPTSGFANFTVLWNSTHVAGNYSAQVDWADNILGEGGSLTSGNFSIRHKFSLTILFPAVNDVITSNSTLSNPPTTVEVKDFYTSQLVTATVKGKTSWEDKTKPWSQFSATVDVGRYTNITNVPNLTPDSTQWIAANATKPFYDLALANNTVFVGTKTICTPLTTSRTIRYTENQAFFVDVNVTYEFLNTTAITGAELTLLAGASSNDSVVQWTVRTVLDTSQNALGKYSARIYMFVTTAKGLPAGHTYNVFFKLTKGQHYQTQTFSLSLTVLTQPTQLSPWSGDATQTVFWGQTAQVRMNFTTRPGGSFDWPTTSSIFNNTLYVPPYITVITDWGGRWTANGSAFFQGTYIFYINTTSFATPTNDGSGAGTTTVNIVFHKPNFDDPQGVTITLHIKRLTTAETGAIQQGGGNIVLTNTTNTYPGDRMTFLVWYNDTHTGSSIGVGGATLTFTSGGTLGSGTLVAFPGRAGLYNLTLSGIITNRTPGTFFLYVAASKGNFYVQRNITLTLNILAIPTNLQAYSPSATISYLDKYVFLVWFNDTHNGVPVVGATMLVNAPGMTLVSPFEVQPGLWNLTVPRGQGVGVYSITLQANKTKYATGVETLTLTINSLQTTFSSYVVTSSGSILVQPNATIPQNQALTIYLWFNDTHGVGIPGMNGSITYSSSEFGNGWVSVTTTPGLYKVTFQTPDAGKFAVTFTVNAPGYESHSFVFQVTVQAPPRGFDIITLAIVGVGGGGIVLAAAAAMIFIRRARMPFIIKKINETLGLINKGQHEQATPLPLKSRDEIVTGIIAERVESFTKRKPSKEEEAEALREEVVPAPTPQTTAALKEELQAVEGEEKPEEGIEEAEMDTLDEQLQQLEKVEDKENLPDGARQVRDVIEKYKEGKKKKKAD